MKVAQGVVTDIASPAERPKLLAHIGACLAGAFVIGPLISGLLAVYSLRLPLFVAAGSSGIALLVAIVKLRETNEAVLRQQTKRNADDVCAIGEFGGATMRAADTLGDEKSAESFASDDSESNLKLEEESESSDGKSTAKGRKLKDEENEIGDGKSTTKGRKLKDEESGNKADDSVPRRTQMLVLCAAFLTFAAMFSQVSLMTLLALVVDCRFGWTASEVGFVIGAAGLVVVLVQAVAFARVQRWLGSSPRVGVLGLVSSLAGQAIILSGDSIPTLLVGLYVMFVGTGLVMPATPTIISFLAPKRKQVSFVFFSHGIKM